MANIDAPLKAGKFLRRLIEENYTTQEKFAAEIYTDYRTVNRWINQGINRVDTIQVLAAYFKVDFLDFFRD